MKELNFQSDILPLKDKLFRLALRITLDRAEAEDIVQDTLLRVWQRRDEWSSISNPDSYSTTICRNLALDRCQAARRSNMTLDGEQAPTLSDTAPPPDVALQRQERIAIIRQLMDQLPEAQRTIMELRDMEGRSYQEIADIMNITEAQVKVYLHRARTRIRTEAEKIERYGL